MFGGTKENVMSDTPAGRWISSNNGPDGVTVAPAPLTEAVHPAESSSSRTSSVGRWQVAVTVVQVAWLSEHAPDAVVQNGVGCGSR